MLDDRGLWHVMRLASLLFGWALSVVAMVTYISVSMPALWWLIRAALKPAEKALEGRVAGGGAGDRRSAQRRSAATDVSLGSESRRGTAGVRSVWRFRSRPYPPAHQTPQPGRVSHELAAEGRRARRTCDSAADGDQPKDHAMIRP